jgi:tetratricopeptide (TPR) repeat protein
MKIDDTGAWGRATELALLALVFLAPLAAHGRTFDPSALRTALAEAAALALALTWVMKGLARGRWEAAASSGPVLVPLAALAAWTLACFAAEPYKTAALPALAAALPAWLVYAAALLELGGARAAARLAFWTAASAAVVGAVGAWQRLGGAGAVAATLGTGADLAAFAAAALPAALALGLDPEAPASRRSLSTAAAAALALLAAWSNSPSGLAYFALSASAFGATVVLILGETSTRRSVWTALGCAAGALAIASLMGTPLLAASSLHGAGRAAAAAPIAVWLERPLVGIGPGGLSLRVPAVVGGTALLRALAETGLIGGGLLLWTWTAAVLAGLGAAWNLRRRGALPEARFAAAFAAGFGAWALSAAAGLAPETGPAAWLAWGLGGVAAGLGPLARPRGVVRTLPLPFGHDVRRLLQGSALSLFALLLAAPGAWLASDVRYNRAVAALRAGRFEDSLADAGGVWPGSAPYPAALELRGRALLALGRPREALDAYARLEDVVPDFARRHAALAEAYAALGDWPSAARERARQDALSPDGVRSLVAWAQAARGAGDLESARRAADRAAALAPDDPSVRAELAANALLEKRLAADEARRRKAERQAFKGRPKSR